MLKILKLEIDCGETTCATEPGKFCKYFLTSRFGQAFHCQLFSETTDRGSLEELKEHQSGKFKGWISRHKDCMNKCIIDNTVP